VLFSTRFEHCAEKQTHPSSTTNKSGAPPGILVDFFAPSFSQWFQDTSVLWASVDTKGCINVLDAANTETPGQKVIPESSWPGQEGAMP